MEVWSEEGGRKGKVKGWGKGGGGGVGKGNVRKDGRGGWKGNMRVRENEEVGGRNCLGVSIIYVAYTGSYSIAKKRSKKTRLLLPIQKLALFSSYQHREEYIYTYGTVDRG